MEMVALESTASPHFADFVRLYESSFPPYEREPLDEVRGQIDSPVDPQRFWNFVGVRSGAVVAILRLGYLPETQVGFVVHIAVDPSVRGQGLGGEVLEFAHAHCQNVDAGFRGLILEVERAEDAEDPEAMVERSRRVEWFQRHGAQFISRAYTQPSLGPGLPPVILNLMMIGEVPANPRTMVADFYAEAWGLEPEHPFVRRALRPS
ncbi:MAG: GNAT family N-acetyltransferase [Fimbriimonas sp.]